MATVFNKRLFGTDLDPDIKNKLEVALQEKLNDGLSKYKMQVSKDTDAETQDPTVLGFFIPLSQIKLPTNSPKVSIIITNFEMVKSKMIFPYAP